MKKALKITGIVLTLSIALFFGGSYFLYKNPAIWIDLQLVGKNIDSPEADARLDVENSLIRCYSINGFGPYFPAVQTDEQRKVCNNASEVNFMGTSDAIQSKAHGEAISKAASYAKRYNQYVINNVPSKI